MAKGKEAATSARRQLEAASAHLDRVTTQLVEAKERARRFEAAALRVPGLESEVARLRADLEASDGPHERRVRELMLELSEMRRDHAANVAKLRRYFGRLGRAAGDRWQFRLNEIDDLAALLHMKAADLIHDIDGRPRSFREGGRRITGSESPRSKMERAAGFTPKQLAQDIWCEVDELLNADDFDEAQFLKMMERATAAAAEYA